MATIYKPRRAIKTAVAFTFLAATAAPSGINEVQPRHHNKVQFYHMSPGAVVADTTKSGGDDMRKHGGIRENQNELIMAIIKQFLEKEG